MYMYTYVGFTYLHMYIHVASWATRSRMHITNLSILTLMSIYMCIHTYT